MLKPVCIPPFIALAVVASAAALSAQNISGTVSAAGTAVPIANATVVAIGRVSSTVAQPVVYKSTVDSAGNYTLPVPAGQYQLCVYGAEPYLDPCQWGSPLIATATSSVGAPLSLQLQKGVQFIVRVFDPNGLLSRTESVQGGAAKVYLFGWGRGSTSLGPNLRVPRLPGLRGVYSL